MPYETWPAIISPPQDGEPVDNSTTARAHESLSDRTEYLKQRLEDYSTKNGRVLIQSVLMSEDVNVGDVVYYDSANEIYGRAIAEGVVDTTTGLLSATIRSFAIGLCVSKIDNYGDILVSGASDLSADFLISPEDLFDIASNYSESGTRGYLSSLTPGKLTSKPISPLIQLGMFSSTQSFIAPLQKDIFESHLHYRFSIPTKPAASQNIDKTGIYLTDDIAYVDYYDGPNTFPQVIMSIKKNDSPTSVSSYSPARVIISNRDDGEKLVYSVVTGEIDISGSGEGSTTSVGGELDWPEYGEYIEIPNTGLSVSFSRRDGDYTNTLPEDMLATLTNDEDYFKVFLPDDLNGWTNANQADPETPVGAIYRLVHENIPSLNAVWPPTPLESTGIEMNGTDRIKGLEYVPSMTGIYWKSEAPPWVWNLIPVFDQFGVYTSDVTPDYTIVNEDIEAYAYFSKTSLENSRSVVLSLGSNSPMITVVDCFSGLPSSAGHLKLDLDLSLNEETLIGSNYYGHSTIDPVTNKFKKTSIVSDITAGLGITIAKGGSTPGTEANCGPLTISMSSMKFEGAIEVVSLINAKEDLIDGIVPVIWFLQPSTGSYKMVSRVKVPNEDVPSGTISVRLFPSVFGSETQVGAADAVFNISHYRIRNGASLAAPYQLGYTSEVVFDRTGTTENEIDAVEQEIIVPGSIAAGDQIYTVWERVSTGASDTEDDYVGNLGFSQVRWKINIT